MYDKGFDPADNVDDEGYAGSGAVMLVMHGKGFDPTAKVDDEGYAEVDAARMCA